MNNPNPIKAPTPIIHIHAHILSVLKKTLSFLDYQNYSTNKEAMSFLQSLIDETIQRIP